MMTINILRCLGLLALTIPGVTTAQQTGEGSDVLAMPMCELEQVVAGDCTLQEYCKEFNDFWGGDVASCTGDVKADWKIEMNIGESCMYNTNDQSENEIIFPQYDATLFDASSGDFCFDYSVIDFFREGVALREEHVLTITRPHESVGVIRGVHAVEPCDEEEEWPDIILSGTTTTFCAAKCGQYYLNGMACTSECQECPGEPYSVFTCFNLEPGLQEQCDEKEGFEDIIDYFKRNPSSSGGSNKPSQPPPPPLIYSRYFYQNLVLEINNGVMLEGKGDIAAWERVTENFYTNYFDENLKDDVATTAQIRSHPGRKLQERSDIARFTTNIAFKDQEVKVYYSGRWVNSILYDQTIQYAIEETPDTASEDNDESMIDSDLLLTMPFADSSAVTKYEQDLSKEVPSFQGRKDITTQAPMITEQAVEEVPVSASIQTSLMTTSILWFAILWYTFV